ncbi:hypothetical protein J4401_03345 [Candidatus Woesearchaeota archaeon]|nr:hypothetical protein [Candidatus Woesearchaeota archaeon]
MALEILRKLGLSNGEIKIYATLFNIGRATLQKINENTAIERRNIYDILNKLIEKGLVSYIQENKKRYFQVSHPNSIRHYVSEQKNELLSIEEEIEKHLPEITAKYNVHHYDLNGEIYRGKEGIKAVWEDMLNYKEVRWIGSGRYVPNLFPVWFANWNNRRIKKRVVVCNLFREEFSGKVTPFPLEHIRFLPEEFSGNPCPICVYGNKIVHFVLGGILFAFLIENKETAENYRKYHKYLWEKVAHS